MDERQARQALREALGERGFLDGADVEERYLVDVAGHRGERPLALLRPQNTGEVSRAMAICHAACIAVVPQGGRTGLAQGQLPRAGEAVLSLERMCAIESVDADAGMATVQAGVILQTLQEHVDPLGFLFPLDLGGRGSCTIGGNIATNAGGNRVIRYGMTRELVIGLEAVLADGTVLDGLTPVIKNNTGPDLKQLFIGSEGVLGVITRAIVRLMPKPAERAVALCCLPDFSAVRSLLRRVRSGLGGELTAFEVMWDSYYSRALRVAGRPPPLAGGHPFYALVEASGTDAAAMTGRVEATLQSAIEGGAVIDAVIAKSAAEIEHLWRLRDISVEVARLMVPLVPFDVSVPVADMETFVNRLDAAVLALDPRCDTIVFGHVGDGNLHIGVHRPEDRPELFEIIEESVYSLVGEYRGSVSAEHGIGVLKRDFLRHTRSAAEVATMRALKQALDPRGILNPGRILTPIAPA
ncbi:MAG: FAD-binding oxidoreductase [Betaproteobacteria bacterium]|nr:FAD-binding oxidoreductase [Betaproteobacteria bacterium]